MIECYNGTCVSESNDKLGNIPSFSTMPGETCAPGLPCRDECYAKRMIRSYRKNVVRSWKRNTELVRSRRYEEIIEDITSYIRFKHSGLFRWFVGGDIFDRGMLIAMTRIAKQCPETRFLCFTKRFDLLEEYLEQEMDVPENLNIVLSAWKSYQPSEILKKRFPVCYMDDGTSECEVPPDALTCNGHCIECQACFGLKCGACVKIHKH